MSSIASVTPWEKVKENLVVHDWNGKPCYSPKSQTTASYLTYFMILGEAMLKDMKEAALIRLKGGGGASVFRMNGSSALEKAYSTAIPATNSKEEKTITLHTGISAKNIKMIVNLAKKNILSIYEKEGENHWPLFSYSISREDIEEWHLSALRAIYYKAYETMSIKKSDEPISFSEEQMKRFSITKKGGAVDPKDINCVAFALLQANELAAKEIIFKPPNDKAVHGILDSLKKWNYKAVEEPQEGDLVVYINTDKKPTHMGYYLGSGKIRSKLGVLNHHYHEHKIFDVPHTYGDDVIFFRKGKGSSDEKKIETQAAKK